ncbi:hypothetical protein PVAP13_7NG018717 [Panicum virgatum]|uniref:Secreted protein n=1 Tax=Panicum virgatum TaxID=38727 RepID=A0A8T0PTP7_PANVG|nr:hypothetical protein PVAP13_7NG018717 [Panicum virgatum]
MAIGFKVLSLHPSLAKAILSLIARASMVSASRPWGCHCACRPQKFPAASRRTAPITQSLDVCQFVNIVEHI